LGYSAAQGLMPARRRSHLPARALSASLRLTGGRASQWQAGSGEAGGNDDGCPNPNYDKK